MKPTIIFIHDTDSPFTVDSSKSSTYKVVGEGEFNISYVDGSGATGDYFEDTLTIGGKSLKSFEMGLATDTTISRGIAGIAFANSEAITQIQGGQEYPNLVDAMVNASLIPTQAYSLWLDDIEASTGSLLFGGIDTAKFTGSLTSLELYSSSEDSNEITSFTVAFTGLSATSPTGTDQLTASGYAMPAILDSGTTLTLLPDDLAAIVFQELGASYSSRSGDAIVPCNLRNIDGSLNFAFGGSGGAVIKVPVSELVFEELTDSRGNPETYQNGNAACILGIQPAGDRPVLFGDTFLRSAYVVYDLANNKIGIAQTDFNSTSSNVVEFPSQGAAIPSATTAPNQPGVTQTATGIVGNGGTSTAGSAESTTVSAGTTGTGAAVPGFASATAATTSKSAAVAKVRPGDWVSTLTIAGIVGAMTLGGGLLIWL